MLASKRSPVKLESDRGAELYNSIFENFLKSKIFLKGNSDWLSEITSIMKKNINTIHNSIEMTSIQTSKKSNENEVYSNLQDNREVRKPKFILGQLVRTADIKKVLPKRDSTNYSYKLYTITDVLHNTIPNYKLNYLHESYNQNLLLPTKLSFEQNNQIMKELNLIQ